MKLRLRHHTLNRRPRGLDCVGRIVGAAGAFVLLLSTNAIAQTCPDHIITEVHENITMTRGDDPYRQDFDSTMAPCEDVVVRIFCTLSCSDPTTNISLNLYDHGANWLDGAYFLCGVACLDQVPNSGSDIVASGRAYPAMVGGGAADGTPSYVEIVYGSGGASSRRFTLTVIRVPRWNYNTGGTNFSNAPTISVGDVQYSSLDSSGQYYKVHIGAGETTYVTGRGLGNSTYPSSLYIALYDPNHSFIGYFYSTTFTDTYFFPSPGGSPTLHFWTNTGSAGDFFLQPAGWYNIITDFQIALQTITPSSFSLSGTNTALSMTDTKLYDSTGDTTNYITAVPSPSTAFLNPNYTWGSPTNPNSDCITTLSVTPATGNGSVSSVVSATPTGSGSCANASGIFTVSATAVGVSSDNSLAVVIPPQVLIRTLVGEAVGQTGSGDETMPAILLVAKNRFGDADFTDHGYTGCVGTELQPTNWQTTLVPCQFQGLKFNTTTDGPAPEIKHAAEVFAGTTSVSIDSDLKGYWSPTDDQYSDLSGLTTLTAHDVGNFAWSSMGAPPLWLAYDRQAVIKATIANNVRSGYTTAPAIVMIRKAHSPTDPAVIYIN